MTDYVEASYALVVLTEPRGAERATAHKLLADLLRDGATADDLGNAERRATIAAICALRDLLNQGHMPHEQTWRIAFKGRRALARARIGRYSGTPRERERQGDTTPLRYLLYRRMHFAHPLDEAIGAHTRPDNRR
ncbi:hypothetical protein [Bradyrhizobium sp. LMG 9283]|uniref:hypothetical protein n=1 Tax=Bradyrhizobium sp. LMG 9283 TaxID=592064 RepID=UPI0038910C28